ncbi:MAG: hypothetical protein KJZ83_03240 [Burkholderiaceae bacterium]|nr:hypothetical protein [Burkholderiaceae bacterium]
MHVVASIKCYALAKRRLARGFIADQHWRISRITAEATLCRKSHARARLQRRYARSERGSWR